MTKYAQEHAILAYLRGKGWVDNRKIFKDVTRPIWLPVDFVGDDMAEEDINREILKRLEDHGFLVSKLKEDRGAQPEWHGQAYRMTDIGLEELQRLEKSRNKKPDGLLAEIDSTDWTGLGKRVSPEQARSIKLKAQELLCLIVQSDADSQTKTNAMVRVEAVIKLLEAPNVPWREIVYLLNNPSVTAFLAALNLLQLLLGIATS